MNKILIIGSGGHAKTIVDTIEKQGKFEIVGFVDKENLGQEVYRGYKIVGNDHDLLCLFKEGIRHAVIGIGFMGKSLLRLKLYNMLKAIGFILPVIVDNSAIIAADVVIGEGTYVGRNSVINADAHIGSMVIINTGAIIEHECYIGDFSHLAVGSTICGQVVVRDNVLVGANSTVIQGINIGSGAIVGAGSVVLSNIPCGKTVVGAPARLLGEENE